jgi:phosphoribosyl 1,2-cyclic phosphodiesterase
MISFSSLGSGSEGNSFLIKSNNSVVMIDCGFNFKESTKRLNNLKLSFSDIDLILLTHEHEDHVRAVPQIIKNENIDICSSYGTSKRLGIEKKIKLICHEDLINLDDLKIKVVPVPHDAMEPCHYVFESNGIKAGIITDFGKLTPKIIKEYSGLDLLVIEANHDERLLKESKYPNHLKTRIHGPYGHISNKITREFIEKIDKKKLQKIILCHVSKNNNNSSLIKKELGDIFDKYNCEFVNQDEIYEWVSIKN